jgi:hypothetical protein
MDPATTATKLRIYPPSTERDHRRQWSYGPGIVLFAAALALALITRDLWVVLLIVGVGVLGLALLDPLATRARRFGKNSSEIVNASVEGLSGDAYPLSWYSRVVPPSRTATGSTDTGYVVRSRLVRLVTERAARPNFVPWTRTTIVVYKEGGTILAVLWGREPPGDNSIFHGVSLEIPPKSLDSFLSTALRGGSDIHISPELLTEARRSSVIPCPAHAVRTRSSNFPVALPRLGHNPAAGGTSAEPS